MSVNVKLEEIVEALDYPEEWSCYLDRNTGKIITITEEDEPYVEDYEEGEGKDIAHLPDWQRGAILEARHALESGDVVSLPSKFDLHEWEIMRRFAAEQPEPARGQLLVAIQGRGAFRVFRQTLELLDLRNEWFRFRDSSVKQFVADWLNANGIAFQDP